MVQPMGRSFFKAHVLFHPLGLVVAAEMEAPDSRKPSSFRRPQKLGQMSGSGTLTIAGVTEGIPLTSFPCWPH